jgi:hypothetical protein
VLVSDIRRLLVSAGGMEIASDDVRNISSNFAQSNEIKSFSVNNKKAVF